MDINGASSEQSLDDRDNLRYASLWRLTGGIPQHELKTIVKEASDCEAALEKEIEMLEAAAKGDGPIPNRSATSTIVALPREYDATSTGPNYLSSAGEILATDLTPIDKYFTVSSILGRLRDPLDTPLIPQLGAQGNAATENPKKKNKATNAAQQARQKVVRQYKRLAVLKQQNEIYTQIQKDNIALLALVKRISNHRTAAVFRRAVNPKEAPGYEKRIPFPVDLALIKKFVLCGHINTFEKLHQYIGMICHNCVKFNGRYSDYALLTRDFEAYVDDSFLDFMQKQKDKAAAAAK
jgi:hypothetical protein